MVRPPLPPLESRAERFDLVVVTTAEFLRHAWPELHDIHFGVEDLPPREGSGPMPRWHTSTDERRIILYRVPIERLSKLYRYDALMRRIAIEGHVFRAAAEYLGRDPWDLEPPHHHH